MKKKIYNIEFLCKTLADRTRLRLIGLISSQSVFREVRAALSTHLEMQRDREKLMQVLLRSHAQVNNLRYTCLDNPGSRLRITSRHRSGRCGRVAEGGGLLNR